MKTHRNHKIVAVLKLPRPILALISVAKAIVAALTANKASFPNPDPPLPTVSTAIADLESAQAAVVARTNGAVAGRDQKHAALVTFLLQLKAYVQKMSDADPLHGAQLVGSAAMLVKRVVLPSKHVFAVKSGAVSGAVALTTATAGSRASYEWEWSIDGGKTWQLAPATLQSRTTLTGLQPGATVSFRSRSVTKTGASDWTQPIAVIVK
jgi:hypothetical protein